MKTRLLFLFVSFVLALGACQPAQADPTSTPTLPTPTATPTLDATTWVHRVEGVPSLPGLTIAVYALDLPIIAEERGYPEVQAALGDRSIASALPGGRYQGEQVMLGQMQVNNQVLEPFDYRIETNQPGETFARYFQLYQGDELLLDEIVAFGPVSVNKSGDDFALLVQTNDSFYRARRSGVEEWSSQSTAGRGAPAFRLDDLWYAGEVWSDKGAVVTVYRNGSPVYERIVEQPRGVSPELVSFQTYGEHWALETLDNVVIDGQPVNETYGYDKSFHFQVLGEQPFFLFEKDGQVGMRYGEHEALFGWQSVPHDQCCSGAVDNPVRVGDATWFFAFQNERWYYVEVEASR